MNMDLMTFQTARANKGKYQVLCCQEMDFSCRRRACYFSIKCLGRLAFPMFPLPLRLEELWSCDAFFLVYALRAEDPW